MSDLAAEIPALTDDEGAFLALVVRAQPATAYQLLRICDQSPVTNVGTSKGKVYPLIHRLKSRGFLASKPVSGDARRSEWLVSTDEGEKAVRGWIKGLKPNHLLPEDALRIKFQSFHLLSKTEQWEWLCGAEMALKGKLRELLFHPDPFTGPYNDLVLDSAITAVRSRLDWLARVRSRLMSELDPPEGASTAERNYSRP